MGPAGCTCHSAHTIRHASLWYCCTPAICHSKAQKSQPQQCFARLATNASCQPFRPTYKCLQGPQLPQNPLAAAQQACSGAELAQPYRIAGYLPQLLLLGLFRAYAWPAMSLTVSSTAGEHQQCLWRCHAHIVAQHSWSCWIDRRATHTCTHRREFSHNVAKHAQHFPPHSCAPVHVSPGLQHSAPGDAALRSAANMAGRTAEQTLKPAPKASCHRRSLRLMLPCCSRADRTYLRTGVQRVCNQTMSARTHAHLHARGKRAL